MSGPSEAEHYGVEAAGGDEVVVVLPWPRLLRRRVHGRARASERFQWWVLWSVLAGLLSVNVTFTILAVALPRIGRELGASDATTTWIVTGPLLAFGVAAPILGKAGDVFGHRRLYLAGLGGALVAAALSASAWNAPSLIAVRVFGAVQGAATGAASMALIFSVFDREDRVKAMGFWSLVGAGGPVIGVAIGGPVVQAVGWRWVFAAQVPLILAAFVVAALVLPETERRERQRLDWLGALTLTVAVTSLLLALNSGPSWGWTSARTAAALVVAAVGLAAFLRVERTASPPLIPLRYFRQRNFAFPMGAQVFANFAYMGGFILTPRLLASDLFGYGEARIGYLVLARPLVFSLVAPVAGYVTVRVGERLAAVTGTAAVVVSMLVFTAVDGSSGDLHVMAALALSGVGLGIASPALSSSVANAVRPTDFGIASASQQLLNQVGLVAGIQFMQTVQSSRQAAGLAASFSAAYAVGAAVSVLGVLCAVFVRSAGRADRDEDAPEGALGTAPA